MLSSFLLLNSPNIYANDNLDDEIYITQHWLSLTTSYEIETKTKKLGTLYRKFFSFLLTYEFYDTFDKKIAIAQSKFFSFNAHFDIYDDKKNILGSADEKLFAFFPTFTIYDKNQVSKLAYAKMNFWGTTFYIYDPATDKEMAQMYRPFFRVKNDWTFKVTDKNTFENKNINNRVLMTVIAFQGDREYWESQKSNSSYRLKSNNIQNNAMDSVDVALHKIDLISNQFGIKTINNPESVPLEKVATKLQQDYLKQASASSSSSLSATEQVSAFTEFCLQQVQSDSTDKPTKQAIIYLLKLRLANANGFIS